MMHAYLTAAGDVVLAAQLDEASDRVALLISPVKEVVPHHAWHARVRQDVCIT